MLKNNGKESNRRERKGERRRREEREREKERRTIQKFRAVSLFVATISARFTPIFAPINVRIDSVRLYIPGPWLDIGGGGSSNVPPGSQLPALCFFPDFWPLVLHPFAAILPPLESPKSTSMARNIIHLNDWAVCSAHWELRTASAVETRFSYRSQRYFCRFFSFAILL